MVGLQAMGLHPCPDNTSIMYENVYHYWDGIKKIGSGFKPYTGVTRAIIATSLRTRIVDNCNAPNCFGDFGIVDPARAILEKYARKELWQHWKKVQLSYLALDRLC